MIKWNFRNDVHDPFVTYAYVAVAEGKILDERIARVLFSRSILGKKCTRSSDLLKREHYLAINERIQGVQLAIIQNNIPYIGESQVMHAMLSNKEQCLQLHSACQEPVSTQRQLA